MGSSARSTRFMVALHPPLSGLPFGFVTLLAVVELLRLAPSRNESLSTTRRVLIIAIVVSTLATFLSGYQASDSLGDLSPEVQGELGRHHAYGRFLLINALLMGALSWIASRAIHGKRVMMALYIATVIAQLGLTVAVGYMGGALVFERGLGVQAR